jgi:serine/threonine protein kinase
MPRAESVQLAHFTGTERFECLAKLGAGGFGDVYECFDRYLREPVAVKVLRHLSPDSIASFKHEFRKLALVEHHNLARLLHLEFDVSRNCWFFSMELVRGTHFSPTFEPSAAHSAKLSKVWRSSWR